MEDVIFGLTSRKYWVSVDKDVYNARRRSHFRRFNGGNVVGWSWYEMSEGETSR